VQWPLYLLRCTPPTSTFIKSLVSFDSSFLKMFGCFLGPRSFDSPKGPLIHKEAYLPIAFGGIKLIQTTTIIVITYLGSWDLGALIIIVMFMVDQHPFLFEALTQVDTTPQNNMWSFVSPNMCVSSSFWTTHWVTNCLTLGFHLWMFASSYLL